MKPLPLDDDRLTAGDFVHAVRDDDLVYFCLSVGDADAQVIVLPVGPDGIRRVIVVDAGVTDKVIDLLDTLEQAGLISFANPADATIALVVATHPHHDHIAGMAQLFQARGEHVPRSGNPGSSTPPRLIRTCFGRSAPSLTSSTPSRPAECTASSGRSRSPC